MSKRFFYTYEDPDYLDSMDVNDFDVEDSDEPLFIDELESMSDFLKKEQQNA